MRTLTRSLAPTSTFRAVTIGGVVLMASLGLWHQVLAPGLHLGEGPRFMAFGIFVAGLFSFAFLLGGRRR
jgi:hypothetical protein